MDEEESLKRRKAHENSKIENLLKEYITSEAELRDIISYLIQQREHMRNAELERLEAETDSLIRKLASTKRKILLEEIACFKDILALQKKLLE